MDIIESIKRAGRVINYELRHDPTLVAAVVALAVLLCFAACSIVYAVEHQQRDWVRDCAQMRPLVECREDAEALFGGSE